MQWARKWTVSDARATQKYWLVNSDIHFYCNWCFFFAIFLKPQHARRLICATACSLVQRARLGTALAAVTPVRCLSKRFCIVFAEMYLRNYSRLISAIGAAATAPPTTTIPIKTTCANYMPTTASTYIQARVAGGQPVDHTCTESSHRGLKASRLCLWRPWKRAYKYFCTRTHMHTCSTFIRKCWRD